MRAETAALLLSGQEGGLPLAVLALPVPGADGGPARVPVVIEVDGPSLLAGHEEDTLRVEVCLYALGSGGGVEAALLDTVEIGPSGLARLERSGLKFHGELLLPAGETSLRVLVRNPATHAVGLKRVSLTVPAFSEGTARTARLLPPLFAEPGETWLVARAPAGGAGAGAGPGGIGGLALPAARPVLSPEGEITFQALAYRLGPEPRLTLEIKKRGSERTSELPVRVAERASAGATDLELLSVAVTLRGVEPGEYELRLVSAGTAEAVHSAALPVVVSRGSAGRTWAALGIPASTAATAATAAGGGAGGKAEVEAARQGGRSKHRRVATGPLRTAYKEALRPLASGDEAGARAAVSAFETAQLVTNPEPLAPEELVDVQARVVGEMAKRDLEGIVALLLLYERLYHEALGRRAYVVATHDGELVFGLAELYVRKSRSPAAKEIAASFLVDLARDQLGVTMTTFTRRALLRALTYDESNEAALLALAVDTGRRGDARGAAGFLDRLLRRHPESLEGRLRLGLARARLGDGAKARALLAEVVAAEPPADDRWLLSLAYQELARLQLAANERSAAAATLEAGRQRLPGDAELLLEQAALLDRSGEHGRAREILAGIEPRADAESTPRHRYNQPPDAAFERAWRSLQARTANPARAAATTAGGPGGQQP